MSYCGKLIAKNLRRKYGDAEEEIAESDREYFSLLSPEYRIRFSAYLSGMFNGLAASFGKEILNKLMLTVESERNRKMESYKQVTKWLKTKQKKNL